MKLRSLVESVELTNFGKF